jgi:molecular chaperone DnaK
VHEKARAEQLVAEARQAIEESGALDRVRPLISDLQQLVQGLPASAQAAASAGGGGDETSGRQATADDEEVVDAEFTRE